jgi:predicted ribosome quality control (RQC) complex YloA/Tae2 family protein
VRSSYPRIRICATSERRVPSQPSAQKPPVLNARELAQLVGGIALQAEGLFLDRIQVPERPGGFQKSEWSLVLSGRSGSGTLTFSVRAQAPHIAWYTKNAPKSAKNATRSAFDLSLGKLLRGAKLLRISTEPRDRIVWLDWSNQLRMALVLIPSGPEAVLLKDEQVLARSRYPERTHWSAPPPPPLKRTEELPIREQWVQTPEHYSRCLDAYYLEHAFDLRRKSIQQKLSANLLQSETRIQQATRAQTEAKSEPNWQILGNLLKSALHLAQKDWPKVEVFDYEQDRLCVLDCDPNLTPKEQLDRYYEKARRQKRKIEETTTRILELSENVTRIKSALLKVQQTVDSATLLQVEEEFQLKPPNSDPLTSRVLSRFSGKSYVSRDGWSILVGRSRDENLELTFRVARGNDLWMHVRGKPSSHVVILVPSSKTAPLETLLDAAQLLLHASGGSQWGKTEIDYTYRKFVKKIPNSTQVSYTHNKTLLVTPDPARLARLLSQLGSTS